MRQGLGQSCGNSNEPILVAPIRDRRTFDDRDIHQLKGFWKDNGMYVVRSPEFVWMVYLAEEDWWFICESSNAWVLHLTGNIWVVPGFDEISRIVDGGMAAVAALRLEGKLV